MKKIIYLCLIIFGIIILASCDKNSDTVNKEESKSLDYFVYEENAKYIYEGKGNEYASYTAFIDYKTDNKVQQRINNSGTETINVIEYKDGAITVVFTQGEVYYRENLLQAQSNYNEILLKDPIAKGTEWTLPDGRVRTITDISAKVETPMGSYEAVEVTTKGNDDLIAEYYVKDIGLVKRVFKSGENEITSMLSKIQDNSSLTQKIYFYYPNINDDKIYCASKEIGFKTNDITKDILADAYKEVPEGGANKVFSENTVINSLYLNKDNMVYIDLNDAFVKEMNAGSGYESMILLCVANTFGSYYGSDKVVLTINSEPYSSGHILMKKGEYLKTDFSDVVSTE